MKRMLVLACMLVAGFFIAGCEEEEHEHRYAYHRPYGYRPPYEYRGYRDGYDGRRYRLMDENAQNDTASPVQTPAEP
ncbi:MAG: hypothetical protein M1376_15495 [Planctomycetes bacterium]|nr:hypothetical protein [Planctomycetota bacterium]